MLLKSIVFLLSCNWLCLVSLHIGAVGKTLPVIELFPGQNYLVCVFCQ